MTRPFAVGDRVRAVGFRHGPLREAEGTIVAVSPEAEMLDVYFDRGSHGLFPVDRFPFTYPCLMSEIEFVAQEGDGVGEGEYIYTVWRCQHCEVATITHSDQDDDVRWPTCPNCGSAMGMGEQGIGLVSEREDAEILRRIETNYPAPTATRPGGVERERRRAMVWRSVLVGWFLAAFLAGAASAQSGYEAAIYDACARHGCDPVQLIRVMGCESGGDHSAIGPNGERGIFQFHPQGLWPEIAWADPWTQIEVAAEAFATGLGGHWVCQ